MGQGEAEVEVQATSDHTHSRFNMGPIMSKNYHSHIVAKERLCNLQGRKFPCSGPILTNRADHGHDPPRMQEGGREGERGAPPLSFPPSLQTGRIMVTRLDAAQEPIGPRAASSLPAGRGNSPDPSG